MRKQQCEHQHVRRREEALWASEQVFFCILWEGPCWDRYPHSSHRRDLHWHRLSFPEGTTLEQFLRDCSARAGPMLEQGNSTGEKHRKERVTEMN